MPKIIHQTTIDKQTKTSSETLQRNIGEYLQTTNKHGYQYSHTNLVRDRVFGTEETYVFTHPEGHKLEFRPQGAAHFDKHGKMTHSKFITKPEDLNYHLLTLSRD